MKFRPLHDRVLVKRGDGLTMTKGGIYIPETAKEKPIEAVVVALGNGKIMPDGSLSPIGINIGDVVLFGTFAGTEIKVDDVPYLLLKEEEILGVVADIVK